MKQPLPTEFKNKFDEICSEIEKLRNEKWKLEKDLPWKLYKKEPDKFVFDFSGYWFLCFVLSVVAIAIESEYNNFGLMAFSVIAIVLVFLFIRDSVKDKQLQKYKQDCDLWWKNKKIYDEKQKNIESNFRKLRKFISNLYVWIKSNRENIDISPIQLRRLSYYHNQYIDRHGKFYDETEYDIEYIADIIYKILFEEKPDISSDELEDENEDTNYEEKIYDYIQIENENILSENPWIKDPKDKEAAKTIARLRIKSTDIIKDIMGVSELEAENIINNMEIQETKKVANHVNYEGRISIADKNKAKSILGTKCMACGKDMSEIYGSIGKNYIELHHKIPYADMKENENRTLTINDFCVLCPDCHRMIHKLPDAADIDLLSRIIKINANSDK